MTIKRAIFLAIFCLQLTIPLAALDHNADGVFVRVVDVGDGHCAVVKMPDDHYMIYDAGNFARAMPAIQEIIPDNEEAGRAISNVSSRNGNAVALARAGTLRRNTLPENNLGSDRVFEQYADHRNADRANPGIVIGFIGMHSYTRRPSHGFDFRGRVSWVRLLGVWRAFSQ